MNCGDTPPSRMEGTAASGEVAAEAVMIERPAVPLGETVNDVETEGTNLFAEMGGETDNNNLNFIKSTLTTVIITLIPLIIMLVIWYYNIPLNFVALGYMVYEEKDNNYNKILKAKEYIQSKVSYIVDILYGINVHNNKLNPKRSSFHI